MPESREQKAIRTMRTAMCKLILAALMLAILCATRSMAANDAAAPAKPSQPHIASCQIGFGGLYKVGHWTPLWIEVAGDASREKLRLEVTTLDGDGVRVTVPHLLAARAVADGEANQLTCVYFRPGRLNAAIEVALVSELAGVVDRYELQPGRANDDRPPCTALPATSEVILQIGAASIGLADAVADRDVESNMFDREVATVDDIAALPTEWLGYEGVDVVVLTTGDARFAEALVSDAARFAALRRWVELGGRIVIGCGENANTLLVAGSPLAELVPGRFAELVRLPQTRNVETFANNAVAIGEGPVPAVIAVPRLTDVRGRVELFGQGDNLPLVIRDARGFGVVTFLGLDVDRPPLAAWTGRGDFLRSVLRPLLDSTNVGTASQTIASTGYDDLAGALRQRLGNTFAGVALITFPIVAGAIIAYLLLIGPLDFLFVHELLRRPWVAWVTFPAVVLLTCAAAIAWGRAAKESGTTQLNTIELADFDLTTGQTRGICWTTLYGPQARRYDVTIEPRFPDGAPAEGAVAQLSNWGLAGTGLGGMHAGSFGIDVAQTGYRTSMSLDELQGVPVLTASTKSLLAQWQQPPREAAADAWNVSFALDDDGLVVGRFTNAAGVALKNACLLHGQWGFALGDVRPGATIEIGPNRTPNRTKTLIVRRARRAATPQVADVDREAFLSDRASLEELLNLMMFYQAAGGYDFVRLPNRFQSWCDLSPLLELDRAILVADGESGGSTWLDAATNEPLAPEIEGDARKVVYRFVFPVDNERLAPEN